MNQKEKILSSRYARAFMNLYKEQLTDDLVEKLPFIAEQLDSVRSIILYAQIALSNGSSGEQIETFFENVGFRKKFLPLISELSRANRLTLLPLVLRTIYTYYQEVQEILHFTIESAVELTQQELEGFITFLKKKTDKNIRYTLKHNPDLIAGVKLYSDTLVFEHSIKQLLDKIVRDSSPDKGMVNGY